MILEIGFLITIAKIFPYITVAIYGFMKKYPILGVIGVIGVITTASQFPLFRINREVVEALRLIFAVLLIWHATRLLRRVK